MLILYTATPNPFKKSPMDSGVVINDLVREPNLNIPARNYTAGNIKIIFKHFTLLSIIFSPKEYSCQAYANRLSSQVFSFISVFLLVPSTLISLLNKALSIVINTG